MSSLSPSPSAGNPSWVDPAALMRIQSLELRARVVMEGFIKGMHRSPLHGFSAEFSEYRQYVVGDDPRFIDWKVVARSDRYYVKKFEEETNLRCQLLLDMSASMGYGPDGITKLDYARTLAATLALFLKEQGDAVGLTMFDQGITEYLPARNRSGHLHALMMHLQRAHQGRGTSLGVSLKSAGELIRRRALIVLISDFLAPLDTLEAELSLLGVMRHDVVIFQTLHPSEIEFRFGEAASFHDIESGKQLLIEPTLARDSYLSRFNAHQDRLRQICGRQGAEYLLARTDQPLEQLLFGFLSARRKLAVRHRSSPVAS
jgi:uncharacterized protein (DUF58 family)